MPLRQRPTSLAASSSADGTAAAGAASGLHGLVGDFRSLPERGDVLRKPAGDKETAVPHPPGDDDVLCQLDVRPVSRV